MGVEREYRGEMVDRREELRREMREVIGNRRRKREEAREKERDERR